MFWTVHNFPGVPQKVPAVATDRWRSAASRGLLTSDCEAVISQCWTCSGYWQLSSSHLWKVRASGVEQTQPKANALADMVLHWGKQKFDLYWCSLCSLSIIIMCSHTCSGWRMSERVKFLAKPAVILKVGVLGVRHLTLLSSARPGCIYCRRWWPLETTRLTVEVASYVTTRRGLHK